MKGRMTDFTDYKTKSHWSIHINAGCSDRMNRTRKDGGFACEDAKAAYNHGWNSADAAENKAGRPMP